MAGQWGELGPNPAQYGNGDVAGLLWPAQCPAPLKKRSARMFVCFLLLPGALAVMASVSWPV